VGGLGGGERGRVVGGREREGSVCCAESVGGGRVVWLGGKEEDIGSRKGGCGGWGAGEGDE